MTRAATAAPAEAAGAAAMPAMPAMPLVSIIIVNHNYARYLPALLLTVRAQTYPRIECIIVDDVSSDGSAAVLAAIEEEEPATRIIRREVNGGQTAASLDGLAVARGAYVIFVDGDDLLLPHCVEAHVYAHLSLRHRVGLTSGDMLQFVDDQLVVATGEEFNRYVRSGRGARSDMVRPFLGIAAADPAMARAAARLDGKLHLVPPLSTRWVWSPTSGLCYRRDALALFADNPTLVALRSNTDMYFAHAIGALCGSALIDEPVFAYRIHGGNAFSQRAQLDRTLPFKVKGANDYGELALLAITDQLVRAADRFAPNVWLRLNLAVLLVRLDRRDPDPTLPRWQRRSRLGRRLVEHDRTVRAALGPWLTALLRLWSGVTLRRG